MMQTTDKPDGAATVPWNHMTALILGAGGAIGRHAVDALLRRGAKVRTLVRPASRAATLAGIEVERIPGDLEDPAALERALAGADLLFHCAAPYPRSHFGKARQVAHAVASTEAVLTAARRHVPEELLGAGGSRLRRFEVEQAEGAAATIRLQPEREEEIRRTLRRPDLLEAALRGSLNGSLHPPLAECAALPGLKRIVYVSSITTIGRPRADASGTLRPANEDDRPNRVLASSPYFRMKQEMEAAVTRAAVEGLPAVLVNPTFCIDAFDAGPTSGQILIAIARRALPVYLPGVLNVIATRDVGEGLALAAERGRTGQRYILGGENMTVRDFIVLAAEIAGVPPPRLAMPVRVAEGLAWTTEVLNLVLRRPWPLFPVSGVQMLRESRAVDARLAREELGLPHTPARIAIADALAWYRANGYL